MSFSGDLYPEAGASVVMTTTGDLVRYNAGARQRLGIGSASDVLTVSGGLPAWVAPASASPTITTFNVTLGSSFTTTSSSFVEITNQTVAKPTISSGECLAVFWTSIQNDNDGKLYTMYEDDTSAVSYGKMEGHVDADQTICCGDQSEADGQTYSANTRASAGTETIQYTGDRQTRMTGFGIG